MAHLAARALMPDGAGFQLFSALEGRIYFQVRGMLKQHARSGINGFKIFFHNRSENSFHWED
jgi:hypothetical protein